MSAKANDTRASSAGSSRTRENTGSEISVKSTSTGSTSTTSTIQDKDTRFLEILDIVCENVAQDWRLLAERLKLGGDDILSIAKTHRTAEERIWQTLCRWRAGSPGVTQPRQLIEALQQCRHGRMADMVARLVYSSENIEDVLYMHMEREYKVREAIYIITDSAARHWRQLSQRLGLTRDDIGFIESSLPVGRAREKCMQALYRWRSLVSLKEYKVASLILVLRECQLHDVAVDVTKMAAASPNQFYVRRKKKDVEVPKQHNSNSSGRPRHVMPQEALRHYALNKIFIRFLDDLDSQAHRASPHPLVTLFYQLNGSSISEVSRRGQYLAVLCPSKADQEEIWRMAENGMLSSKLTELLVSEGSREDLGMKDVALRCTVHETELCTPRSGVSQATNRSEY